MSVLTYSDEQKNAAPNQEPSFEHLLRSSSVHESIILTLRVNEITDRDTFVNMFDSEATLKDGAADLGTNLSCESDPWKNGESDDRDQDPDGRCRPSSWCSCYLASRGLVCHDDRV